MSWGATGGPDEPWYTRDSIILLEKLLHKGMVAFEWGGGRSTGWIAKHVKHLTTLEHKNLPEEAWFQKLLSAEVENDNVKIILIKQDPVAHAHVKFIDTFPDEHFDAVFIDGRDRVMCIKHAVSKVKPGGMICLDNSERRYYHEGWEMLSKWKRTITSNIEWETCIWIKPE